MIRQRIREEVRIASLHEVLGADLRSLGLFRIGVGLVLLADLLLRSRWIVEHYSDRGVLPRETMRLGDYEYALHFHLYLFSGDPGVVSLLFALNAVCVVLFLVGYRTRLMTLLCWLCLCSLIIRNGLVVQGGDTLLRMLLFWGMFLPLGARFSLDRRRGVFFSSKAGHAFSAATIALYVQVGLLYFMSGLFKARYSTWLDGSHIYNALSRPDLVKPMGQWLYPHYELLRLLTHTTLIFEVMAPLLLFVPVLFAGFRTGLILFFVLFQLGLLATLNIGLFPFVSIVSLLPFIPGRTWDRLGLSGTGKLREGPDEIEDFRLLGESHTAPLVRPGFLSNAAAAFFLVMVVLWNFAGYDRFFSMQGTATRIAYFFALPQTWNMFSSPAYHSGWLVAAGGLADGRVVDLLREGRPLSWEGPGCVYSEIPYYRWRKYLYDNLRGNSYLGHRSLYIDYLVTDWNSLEDESRQLKWVEIVYMRFDIGPRYDHSPPRPILLYRWDPERLRPAAPVPEQASVTD